jgi:hypothetical protein
MRMADDVYVQMARTWALNQRGRWTDLGDGILIETTITAVAAFAREVAELSALVSGAAMTALHL